jgi:hypothetical protein
MTADAPVLPTNESAPAGPESMSEPEFPAASGIEPAIVAASLFDAPIIEQPAVVGDEPSAPEPAAPAALLADQGSVQAAEADAEGKPTLDEPVMPANWGEPATAEGAITPATEAASGADQESAEAIGADAEGEPEVAGVTPDEPANAEGAASPETEMPAAAEGEHPNWA